ncbi:MAG: hypothetical protein WBG23_10190, partial [Acidobacteriaceae bacterium]
MVYPVEKLQNNSEGSGYSKLTEAKQSWDGVIFVCGFTSMGCKEKAGNPWVFPAVVQCVLKIVTKRELLFAGLDQGRTIST